MWEPPPNTKYNTNEAHTQQQQQQQSLRIRGRPVYFAPRCSTVDCAFPQILGGHFLYPRHIPIPAVPPYYVEMLHFVECRRWRNQHTQKTKSTSRVPLREQQIRTKTNASKSLQGSRHVWCEKQLTQSINCTRFHQCLFESLCRLSIQDAMRMIVASRPEYETNV